VIPSTLDRRWEGEVRPGHFAGVLTVVAKLFNIVQPDIAIFGQKDFQQATLVRAMTRDLDFPVELFIAPTVREADGLAMSSRNRFLGEAERAQALSLSRAVRAIAQAFKRGMREAPRLEYEGRQILALTPELRLDYLALVDPERLEPVLVADPGTVAIVAARIGSTRLIDNAILGAE
jgi:pantoate--beta-alanine ligase